MLEIWAEALAQSGRWKEAKGPSKRSPHLTPGISTSNRTLAKCYLALGVKDRRRTERLCEPRSRGTARTTPLANDLIWLFALMPNVVRNYTEVVDIGRKLIDHRKPAPEQLQYLRSPSLPRRKYPSSLTYLKRSIDGQKGKATSWDWLFTAMARHKSRQPGDREALAKARALIEESPPSWWQFRVELNALLEEAEQELHSRLPARD